MREWLQTLPLVMLVTLRNIADTLIMEHLQGLGLLTPPAPISNRGKRMAKATLKPNVTQTTSAPSKAKRKMSAAQRAKVSKHMKAYWKRYRAAQSKA